MRLRPIVRGLAVASFLWILQGALAGSQLLLFKDFTGFEKHTNSAGVVQEWISPILKPTAPWDELVVSWNLRGNGAVELSAQAIWSDHESTRYVMGRWANGGGVRESVPHQSDEDGKVLTDTLVLKRSAEGLRLQLKLTRGSDSWPDLSLVGVSFWNKSSPPTEERFSGPAVDLDVPARTQTAWPEGVQNWCSPTTTSMLLAYWGRHLARTNLQFTVPEVVHEVNDPNWGGTGNWPFNMAFVGRQPGMRGCVARVDGLKALEALLHAGIPVGISVSYSQLQGKPNAKSGDGHLIVLRGFDGAGKVLINDPGVRLERVQRSFPVEDFLRAWDNSSRTVYLVWPESKSLPPEVGAEWR
jgi:hypothetical protein